MSTRDSCFGADSRIYVLLMIVMKNGTILMTVSRLWRFKLIPFCLPIPYYDYIFLDENFPKSHDGIDFDDSDGDSNDNWDDIVDDDGDDIGDDDDEEVDVDNFWYTRLATKVQHRPHSDGLSCP